jgi:hypothetical protein
VRFDDVPIGKVIRGHAALSYWLERRRKGAPITVSVQVADQTIGEVQHKDGEGWKSFELSTERFAGQRTTVQFEISSPKGGIQRPFCFQAEAL